jgi:hypothetical protein
MITASPIEVLIAVIDSKIVGSGYARIETIKPYLNHDNYAYLGFVHRPKHRGRSQCKYCEAQKNGVNLKI